jgi:hypothetical protein
LMRMRAPSHSNRFDYPTFFNAQDLWDKSEPSSSFI